MEVQMLCPRLEDEKKNVKHDRRRPMCQTDTPWMRKLCNLEVTRPLLVRETIGQTRPSFLPQGETPCAGGIPSEDNQFGKNSSFIGDLYTQVSRISNPRW